MSKKNIVLLVWQDSSTAYKAYSEIRNALDTTASAVVQRNSDGSFDVRDGFNRQLGLGALGGTAIGSLLGVLGGPLGVILGFTGGLLVGGSWDAKHEITTEEVLANFSRLIPPGKTGLILEIEENSPDWIDSYAADTMATVHRESVERVLDELALAEAAGEAAEKEARQVIRQRKKALHKAKRDELIERLQAKLKIGNDA